MDPSMQHMFGSGQMRAQLRAAMAMDTCEEDGMPFYSLGCRARSTTPTATKMKMTTALSAR